jgi:hypothetical protein
LFLIIARSTIRPGILFFFVFLLTKWGAFRVYVIQVNEYEEQQQVNWLILVGKKKERKEKINARERAHCKRRRRVSEEEEEMLI